MLIERADRVVSLCEMKYYDGFYSMKKGDGEDLQNKIQEVKALVHRKSVQVVLITPYGLTQTAYSVNAIHRVIVLKDLL